MLNAFSVRLDNFSLVMLIRIPGKVKVNPAFSCLFSFPFGVIQADALSLGAARRPNKLSYQGNQIAIRRRVLTAKKILFKAFIRNAAVLT
jgi:hypothetical protein